MSVLHFIAANWLLLLAGCAALFMVGLGLYIVGKMIQHKGERIMAEAMYDTPEEREQLISEAKNVQGWDTFDPGGHGEYASPIYPPV